MSTNLNNTDPSSNDEERAQSSGWARLPPTRTRERVKIDQFSLSVIVRDEETEQIGYPIVTYALDAYSGCICGMHVAVDAPGVLTPAAIGIAEPCKQRYLLDRILRHRPQTVPSDEQRRGAGARAVLALYAAYRRDLGSDPENLGRLVVEVLAEMPYPDHADRRLDAPIVRGLVEGGAMAIPDPWDETWILGIEEILEMRCEEEGEYPAFGLRARLDLILEHPDGAIEALDYENSARGARDPMRDGIFHLLLRARYGEDRPILLTTLYLGSGYRRTVALAEDEVDRVRRCVGEIALDIASETEWAPTPHTGCEWCPYRLDGCSLGPKPYSGRAGRVASGARLHVVRPGVAAERDSETLKGVDDGIARLREKRRQRTGAYGGDHNGEDGSAG